VTRAAVLYAPGHLRVEDVRPGELTGDDGWVRVLHCGVCGSDVGLLAGKIPAALPAVIGHEIVGVIEELGPGGAETHGVAVGDVVVLEFPIRCGRCRFCLTGEYRLCDRARGYGGPVSMLEPPHIWGGMAERVYLSPYSNAHRVPDGLEPEIALLACAVLGNGVRWTAQLGGAGVGDVVVVLGCGPQGLSCVVAAAEAGAAAVVAVGRASSAHRMELAAALGATALARTDVDDPVRAILDVAGGPADLVVDTTGAIEGALLAAQLARKGGRVIVAGQSGAETQPLPLDLMVEREIAVIGANSHDMRAVGPALSILASRRWPMEAMITHRVGLGDARRAIDLVRDPDARAVKVVVNPGVA
jgi:alcohol dehydrogenase